MSTTVIEDANVQYINKFYVYGLDHCWCKQRRTRVGWVTTAFVNFNAMVVMGNTIVAEEVKDFLDETEDDLPTLTWKIVTLTRRLRSKFKSNK